MLLLDTHALLWWSSEPSRVSAQAQAAIEGASTLAICPITWYELSWMAANGRVQPTIPVASWLSGLASQVQSLQITPAIAGRAAELPPNFPKDPADRLIFATAVEHGIRLVTKDRGLRDHKASRAVTLW